MRNDYIITIRNLKLRIYKYTFFLIITIKEGSISRKLRAKMKTKRLLKTGKQHGFVSDGGRAFCM